MLKVEKWFLLKKFIPSNNMPRYIQTIHPIKQIRNINASMIIHMMVNRLRIALIPCFLTIALSANSQQKALSFNEVFITPVKEILNPLPQYSGWADDTHYIEYRLEGQQNKPYTVDVKTGDAVPSAPSQVNEASVFIRNKDVIFKDAAGAEKQLTRDTALEKTQPFLQIKSRLHLPGITIFSP